MILDVVNSNISGSAVQQQVQPCTSEGSQLEAPLLFLSIIQKENRIEMNEMKLLKTVKIPKPSFKGYTKTGECIFHCECCGKISNLGDWFDPKNQFVIRRNQEFDTELQYKNTLVVVCPNCNHETENFMDIGVQGATNMRHRYDISELRTINVYGNDDKIAVSSFYVNPIFIKSKDGFKLSLESSTKRIVFNLKTGLTYELPCKNSKGKVLYGKLTNATYSNFRCFLSNQKYAEVAEYVKSIVAPHVDDILTLEELKFFNRVPQLKVEQVKDLIFLNTKVFKNNASCIFKNVQKNDSANVFVSKVCSNLGLPNSKGARKMITSMENMYLLSAIHNMGISDINNKRTLLSLISTLDKTQGVYISLESLTNETTCKFIKALVKHRGENTVTRMVSQALKVQVRNSDGCMYYVTDANLIHDSASLYADYTKAGIDATTYLNGKLREIHDGLAKDHSKIAAYLDTIPFKYTDKERELEWKDTYSFNLMKNKAEMVSVGRDMHICVGGSTYTNSAEKKTGYYINVTHNSEYKCCIELSKDLDLLQVKAFGNSMAKGELAEAVREWVKMHPEVKAKGCSDYIQMR